MSIRLPTLAWIICVFFGVAVAILAHNAKPVDSPSVAGVAVGGSFTLTDHNGQTITERSWPNKYLLVYFGFTHCPDICPVGLNKIAEVMHDLPQAQSPKVQPLFITLDPTRDSAAVLKDYVAPFKSNIIGLTGTQQQIDHVIKLYRVYAQKQGDGPDYMINHSGYMYLMKPDGQNAAIFAHDMSTDDIVKTIRSSVI